MTREASAVQLPSVLKLPFSECRAWPLFRTARDTALTLFVVELVLSGLVMSFVSYTEIDWDAYMSEVSGWLVDGEWDYAKLSGCTGPLVYPSGFVYIFSALFLICGSGGIFCAQIVFVLLHATLAALIGAILWLASNGSVPLWVIACGMVSRRVHSIFVLRLFNDCFAATFQYAAVFFLIRYFYNLTENQKAKDKGKKESHATEARSAAYALFSTSPNAAEGEFANVAYSLWLCALCHTLAVSVKMSALLWAPGIAIVWFFHCVPQSDCRRCVSLIGTCAEVQLLFAAPFLWRHPVSYVSRAFNFAKDFEYKWSVNYQFISEPLFLDKRFGLCLLFAMTVALLFCAYNLWVKPMPHTVARFKAMDAATPKPLDVGGSNHWTYGKESAKKSDKRKSAKKRKSKKGKKGKKAKQRVDGDASDSETSALSADDWGQEMLGLRVLDILYSSHLVGIVFAKSLHYQFYVWYFHTLPYLLWRSTLHPLLAWFLLGCVEVVWNVYPPNAKASMALHFLHAVILGSALLFQFDYVFPNTRKSKTPQIEMPIPRVLATGQKLKQQ